MRGKAAAFLAGVRRPGPPVGKMCVLRCGLCFLLAGAAAGVLAQLADLFWANGGDFLSQMSVWIFLGTLISALSRSPRRAALYVLLFSAAMLPAYYLTAELAGGYYSPAFAAGWAVFCCLTPLFGWLAWYGRGRGWFARLIGAGILGTMLLCAAVLFDRVRATDLIFMILTAILLLWRPRGRLP